MISKLIVLTAIVGASTTTAYVDPCPAICAITSDCRKSKYGSYCKQAKLPDPSVCFGLYHLPDGTIRYCFQPEDKGCNDSQLSPVRCDVATTVVSP